MKGPLQNSHEDVKYNIENMVNNIVIIMYGARWVPDLWGEANHYAGTPETNPNI